MDDTPDVEHNKKLSTKGDDAKDDGSQYGSQHGSQYGSQHGSIHGTGRSSMGSYEPSHRKSIQTSQNVHRDPENDMDDDHSMHNTYHQDKDTVQDIPENTDHLSNYSNYSNYKPKNEDEGIIHAEEEYLEDNEVDQVIHNILNIHEEEPGVGYLAKEAAEAHPAALQYQTQSSSSCCGVQVPRLWEPVPRYTPEYNDSMKKLLYKVRDSHTTMITSHFTARATLPSLAVVLHKTKGQPRLIQPLIAPFVKVHVVDKRTGAYVFLPAQQLQAQYTDQEYAVQPRVEAQTSARCILQKMPKEGVQAQAGQRVIYGSMDADWSVRTACIEPNAWVHDTVMQQKLQSSAGHHGVVSFPLLPLATALHEDCMVQQEILDLPLHIKKESSSPHRVLWGYLHLNKTVNVDALRNMKPGDSTFDSLCEGKWLFNIGHVKVALHEYMQPLHGDGHTPGVFQEYTALLNARGKTTGGFIQVTIGGISPECLTTQQVGDGGNQDILLAMDASQNDEAQRKALLALNRQRASTLFHTAQSLCFRRNDVTVQPSIIGTACQVSGGRRGVSSVVFSPNGKFLVVASAETDNYAIKLYEHGPVHTQAPGVTNEEVTRVASDMRAHLQWNLMKTLPGHLDYIYTTIFSPCGTWLCTTSSDGFAKLWKLETDLVQHHDIWTKDPTIEIPDSVTRLSVQARNTLQHMNAPYASLWHPVPVYSACFLTMKLTEDRSALVAVTVGQDAFLRFWHCESGEQLATLSIFSLVPNTADNDDNSNNTKHTAQYGNLNHAINNANLTELLHTQTFTRENMLLLSDTNSVTSVRLNDIKATSDGSLLFVCDNKGAVYILQDTQSSTGFDPVFGQYQQVHSQQITTQLAQMWRARFKLVKTVHTGKPVTNLTVSDSRQCVIGRTTKNCLVRISLTRLCVEREYGPITTNNQFAPLTISPCDRYVGCGTATGSLVYVDLEKHYLLGNIAVSVAGLAAKQDSSLASMPTPQAPELPVNAVAWNPHMQMVVTGVFGADLSAKVIYASKTPSQQVYNAYTKRNMTGTDAFIRMVADKAWERGRLKKEQTEATGMQTIQTEHTTIQTTESEIVHITYKDTAIAKERAVARVNERQKLKYGLDLQGTKVDSQLLIEDKTTKE